MGIVSNNRTRKTPTQRQIESLADLTQGELVTKALEAMHALNKRAKVTRYRGSKHRRATFARALGDQIDAIYALKDRFLDALTVSGRARVYTFVVAGQSETYCDACDRTWWGGGRCYVCGADGLHIPSQDRWFVVAAEGFRFHQAWMNGAAAASALPIEPHDPDQPARQIDVTVQVAARGGSRRMKLTIQAQVACVEMAIALLTFPIGTEQVSA